MEWSSQLNLSLVIDLKQKRSFHSARWVTLYDGQHLQTSVHVLDDFPHRQHRPIVTHVGLRITLIRSLQTPRWNFRNAKWTKLSQQLEQSIICIPNNGSSVTEPYLRLNKAILISAKNSIPRGVRPRYIPCMDMWSVLIMPVERDGSSLDITHSSRKG